MKIYDINITKRFKDRFDKKELSLFLSDWEELDCTSFTIIPTKMLFYGILFEGTYKGNWMSVEKELNGTVIFRYHDRVVFDEELSEKEQILASLIVKEGQKFYTELGCPTIEKIQGAK